MIVRMLLPDRLLYRADATKVVAPTTTGSRGFLPRHIDCVAPLREGIVIVTESDGKETFLATDRGLLVKKGDELTITSPRGVVSDRLEVLHDHIRRLRKEEDEFVRESRRVMVQLETRLVREFLELMR